MSGTKQELPTPTPTDSRIDIRNKIFGAKPDSKVIEFFGTQIELRQPQLGIVMDARLQDQQEASMNMLLNFAFVPGTDERIFEPSDEDAVRQIPMGPDMQRLFDAVNELMGLTKEGLDGQVNGAMKTPGEGRPAADGNVDSGGAA